MKILIAYDGSPDAEAAIDDLSKAGLPLAGEATVLTVAEVWLPPSDGIESSVPDDQIEELLGRHRAKGKALVGAAEANAAKAAGRIRVALPGWQVATETTYGSPGWEILDAAEKKGVDLIIVGSQGQSALSRMLMGSISQKVITEARCSVRVARGKNDVDPSPIRIVVGFDGTKGAQAAIDVVASRHWPEGTEVRLVSVVEDAATTFAGEFVPPLVVATEEIVAADTALMHNLSGHAVGRLESAGLKVQHLVIEGSAKNAIVEEAETWNADVIFVGANAFGSDLERFLIGSTSAAIAARAHCSVEVVRVAANAQR
jgi:nucleotide-binding universal stress UspA family protein